MKNQTKFKVPHKIKVGPRVFTVEYKLAIKEDGGEEVSGSCSPSTDTIMISLTQNKNKKFLFSTIFHEFCHAILYVSGQTSRFDKEGNQEEDLAIFLESYLEDMIDWKNHIWMNWKTVTLSPKDEAD